MSERVLPFVLLTLVAALARAADPADLVATNPAAAGPDFLIQGEYLAEGAAAQVIALGDGKFRIVGYEHGLPGMSAEVEKKGEVEASGGPEVKFETDRWKGTISNGALVATDREGATYRLKKTERKSPTLGAPPPTGAVVLFSGANADAWQGGKLDEEGNLRAGTKSKQSFGDCTVHVEFRTPFMPKARGQARGNSGVYLQDRFEVQVLDSFGLAGENNECGGIYSIARPRVNMCFPPLTWQTYDIDFETAKYDGTGKKTKNATLTVKHNGVLIHERVEVGKTTTAAGRAEGAEPGPIQLQDHGNPVVYRNIWVVPK